MVSQVEGGGQGRTYGGGEAVGDGQAGHTQGNVSRGGMVSKRQGHGRLERHGCQQEDTGGQARYKQPVRRRLRHEVHGRHVGDVRDPGRRIASGHHLQHAGDDTFADTAQRGHVLGGHDTAANKERQGGLEAEAVTLSLATQRREVSL